MSEVRAYSLRIHDKAELSIVGFEDRLEITLTNKETGDTAEETYYKIDTAFLAAEAMKIDTIIYHMHNKIGLNLWDIVAKKELK